MSLPKHSRIGLLVLAALLAGGAAAQERSRAPGPGSPRTSLEVGFRHPPNSARPRVWWHWMNGNVTKDGIRKDMEWMSRVGVGGLQNFDAALATPQVVDRRLVYMTPEWKDAFRYSARLADRLGLELAIAASPGWSETGGPRVPPQDGMKKLVWSETAVTGGAPVLIQLSRPPDVTGPFQDLPASPDFAETNTGRPKPTYYADIAVMAYPAGDAEGAPTPVITASDGKLLDAKVLSDGSYQTAQEVPRADQDGPGFVTIDFGSDQTICSLSLSIIGAAALFQGPSVLPRLEVSDGTGGWRKISDVPVDAAGQTTVAFAPVRSRLFRIVFEPVHAAGLEDLGGAPGASIAPLVPSATKATLTLAELRLSAQDRVDRFEVKAGFGVVADYYSLHAGASEGPAPAPTAVVDLTGKMTPSGVLDWTPPPGRWRVLRLGYSLTGTTNHPATAEATGLEVDKYDGGAVRRYLQTYLGMYAGTTGPNLIGRRGVRALLTDSIEVGPSNWTPKLISDFHRLRGYDPRPWLPTLTGAVIGSRSQSDAFLYDFRRTLADLLASEHYGQVAAVAHEHGLTLYGEALESGRPSLGDDIAMRSHADVPMAALWSYRPDRGPRPTLLADMKGAASAAHIYGRNLVAAESMTSAFSPWAFAPSDLKPYIDLEFAFGINRPVIHTSVHQPVDDKLPGLSLAIFGQYFNRHETWAEMAGPWIDYISRSSYLLQQGRYYADVAYFFGEEAPLTSLYDAATVTDAPVRYGYDFVDPDVLVNRLNVEGHDLVAEGGARYRILYLGGSSRRMTLTVLRRLAGLAQAGATVVGEPPEGSPSLKDDPTEFAALVRRLWAGGAETQVGAGRVIAGNDVEAALAHVGLGPDVTFDGLDHDDFGLNQSKIMNVIDSKHLERDLRGKPVPTLPHPALAADSRILFLHRRLAAADIYFLNSRRDRPEHVEARFRVAGRRPELWRADTGVVEPLAYRTEGAQTVVPLDLAAQDAVFVVFRQPVKSAILNVRKPPLRRVLGLDASWTVAFQSWRGAPPQMTMPKLTPLNESREEGVRYFSGTATYRTSLVRPKGVDPGGPLLLDLGKVGDVAEVRVNGRSAGFAWKAPFRVDVGRLLRPGANAIEVRVADLWVNRLIGDAQPGARKITFTTVPTYLPDAPLRPAGLIGPVTLLSGGER